MARAARRSLLFWIASAGFIRLAMMVRAPGEVSLDWPPLAL